MKKNYTSLSPEGQKRLERLLRTRGASTAGELIGSTRTTVDTLASGGFARPQVIARIEDALKRMEAGHDDGSVSRAS